eukprot:187223-Pleurochrysis_carterae.AAC.2
MLPDQQALGGDRDPAGVWSHPDASQPGDDLDFVAIYDELVKVIRIVVGDDLALLAVVCGDDVESRSVLEDAETHHIVVAAEERLVFAFHRFDGRVIPIKFAPHDTLDSPLVERRQSSSFAG